MGRSYEYLLFCHVDTWISESVFAGYVQISEKSPVYFQLSIFCVDMVRQCLVPGCKVTEWSHPKMHFFRLPEDAERRTVWLRNMRAENTRLYYRPAVCMLHFRDDDFTDRGSRLRLKKTAAPTVLDPNCPVVSWSALTFLEFEFYLVVINFLSFSQDLMHVQILHWYKQCFALFSRKTPYMDKRRNQHRPVLRSARPVKAMYPKWRQCHRTLKWRQR